MNCIVLTDIFDIWLANPAELNVESIATAAADQQSPLRDLNSSDMISNDDDDGLVSIWVLCYLTVAKPKWILYPMCVYVHIMCVR